MIILIPWGGAANWISREKNNFKSQLSFFRWGQKILNSLFEAEIRNESTSPLMKILEAGASLSGLLLAPSIVAGRSVIITTDSQAVAKGFYRQNAR